MAPKNTVSTVLSEDVVTITQAQDDLQNILKKGIDRSTIYRWMMRGLKGVKLEHCRIGNTLVTSRESLTRFVAKLNEA